MVRLWLTLLLCVLYPASVRAEGGPNVLELGKSAPDFSLTGVDGKIYTLASFEKSPVLLVMFTCNHCPTAQAYEERIKALAAAYGPKGVALVAISPNDAEAVRPDELGYTDLGDGLADMKVRARDRGFLFPYLYGGGPHEAASKAYGPVATPHAFVFDAKRKLRYVGRIDDSERDSLVKEHSLRNALDALLSGKPVKTPRTKVFGCSTKWSDKRASAKAFLEKVAAEPVALTPADAAALAALRRNEKAKGEDPKIRLINVWATWCGPCTTEFPEFVTTNLMYRHRDFEFVTVAAQFPDEQDKVLKFLKKHQASGKNLIFAGTDKYKLIEALDPSWDGALPYTLLIGSDGKILYRQQGPVDMLKLRRAIVPALNILSPWN